MRDGDSIVAIATPAGAGGIGILLYSSINQSCASSGTVLNMPCRFFVTKERLYQ